jgi:hypothetical protein
MNGGIQMSSIQPGVTGRKQGQASGDAPFPSHGRPPPDRSAFTISEFCQRNGISRGMFYKMQAAGKGPRLMEIGSHKRISAEAELDWKRACEADAGEQ